MWLALLLPAFGAADTPGGDAKAKESTKETAAKNNEEPDGSQTERSGGRRPPVIANQPIPDIVAPIEDVRSALREDLSIREMARDVKVRVEGITLILEGPVATEAARKGILTAAEHAARTFRVEDRMTVRK